MKRWICPTPSDTAEGVIVGEDKLYDSTLREGLNDSCSGWDAEDLAVKFLIDARLGIPAPLAPASAIEDLSGGCFPELGPTEHRKDELTRKARNTHTHIVAKAQTGICPPFWGAPMVSKYRNIARRTTP